MSGRFKHNWCTLYILVAMRRPIQEMAPAPVTLTVTAPCAPLTAPTQDFVRPMTLMAEDWSRRRSANHVSHWVRWKYILVLTHRGAQVVLDSLSSYFSAQSMLLSESIIHLVILDWYNQVWSGEDCEVTGEKSDNGGVTIHLLEEIHWFLWWFRFELRKWLWLSRLCSLLQ